MQLNKNLFLMLLMSMMTALAIGCGDDSTEDTNPGTDNEEDSEELEIEGCEHMKEGPNVGVDAGADQAAAVDATAEHTRVDITLAAIEGGNGGFVTYEAEGEGDYVFFLDKDVPLTITDAQGTALEIEESGPVDLCTEVVIHHVVELPLGVVNIQIGPTTETTLSMVVEAGGEHDHEEGEDHDHEDEDHDHEEGEDHDHEEGEDHDHEEGEDHDGEEEGG